MFKVGDTIVNRVGEVGKVTGVTDDRKHPFRVRFDNRIYTVSKKGKYYSDNDEGDDDDVRLLSKLEKALK